jgi:hypothetical protein
MLDANAAPLIAAWDYVEATGDKRWLAWQIEKLELMADFLAKHDADRDGLIELKNSGNYGEKTGYNSAWDCYNEGHKDGYINLLDDLGRQALRLRGALDLQLVVPPSRPVARASIPRAAVQAVGGQPLKMPERQIS